MAIWDSADLLARVKRYANRPATDQSIADADWYAFLTEAQAEWVTELAQQVPDVMYTFETLTTNDSGVSYDFTAAPLGQYEVRESANGRLLIPGPNWDTAADFIVDGSKIRFPGGKSRTYSSGPVARYVKTPGTLDGSNQPTLKPDAARILIVYRALINWAVRTADRDPQPFRDLENEAWYGDPARGKNGWLGTLKQQALFSGSAAFDQTASVWGQVDTGEGYTRYVP